MRDGIADQKLGLDPYRSMDSEKIQETVESVENMIEVVSQAWSESSKPPKILYRKFFFIFDKNWILLV